MSTETVRHFRGEDGRVVSAGPKMAGYYIAHPGFEEVQVAPVDAYVLDGPLPEVEVSDRGAIRVDGMTIGGENDGAEYYDLMALRYAASARRLRGQPSVDEAQVQALAGLIRQTGDDSFWATKDDADGARWLVQRGVRVEAAS